ncbi:MAG: histidine kinase [Verrucomicrobiia bacterium]
MKRTSTKLAQQYEAALRRYLRQGARTDLPLARRVGKQAASLGLKVLDLARLHDKVLDKVEQPVTRNGAPHRGDPFFAEAFKEWGQTGPSARQAAVRLRQLDQQLRQRTRDLANSRRVRKQALADRNAFKHALKNKTKHHASLLAESRDLRRCLQSLTRRMLSAQENERATVSRTLHDDVAQGLLGIQVRLAHLKKEAARNTTGLRKELIVTQRLVEKSAKTLERFAGKLG